MIVECLGNIIDLEHLSFLGKKYIYDKSHSIAFEIVVGGEHINIYSDYESGNRAYDKLKQQFKEFRKDEWVVL